MKCINPTKFNKTSGFQRCNTCMNCRITNKQKWITRLYFELRHHNLTGSFITLTYDPEHLPEKEKYLTGNLQKSDVQKFIKQIRNQYRNNNKRISYYSVGEYGEKGERAHYHICLFGVSPYQAQQLIKKAWTKGFVKIDDLSMHDFQRLNYTLGYTIKKMTNEKDFPDGRQPEFALMSRNPALGVEYLCEFENYVKKTKQYPVSGATQFQRWFMEKNHPHITAWQGNFKTQGKNMMLDKHLSKKLFEKIYGNEIQQASDHDEKHFSLDREFKEFKKLEREDNEILTKKYLKGEEHQSAINLSEKAQRRYNNALAFRM